MAKKKLTIDIINKKKRGKLLKHTLQKKLKGGSKLNFEYFVKDINNDLKKYKILYIERQKRLLNLCSNVITEINNKNNSINNRFKIQSYSNKYNISRYLTLVNREFYQNIFKKYFINIIQLFDEKNFTNIQENLKGIARELQFMNKEETNEDKEMLINKDFKMFEKYTVDDVVNPEDLKESIKNSFSEMKSILNIKKGDNKDNKNKESFDSASIKNNLNTISDDIDKWGIPEWQDVLLNIFNYEISNIKNIYEDPSSIIKNTINNKYYLDYVSEIHEYLLIEYSSIESKKGNKKLSEELKLKVEKLIEIITNAMSKKNNDKINRDRDDVLIRVILIIKKHLLKLVRENYLNSLGNIEALKNYIEKELSSLHNSIDEYVNKLNSIAITENVKEPKPEKKDEIIDVKPEKAPTTDEFSSIIANPSNSLDQKNMDMLLSTPPSTQPSTLLSTLSIPSPHGSPDGSLQSLPQSSQYGSLQNSYPYQGNANESYEYSDNGRIFYVSGNNQPKIDRKFADWLSNRNQGVGYQYNTNAGYSYSPYQVVGYPYPYYQGGSNEKKTSIKNNYKVCSYITDVEGNMEYFEKYVKISKVIEWVNEKKDKLQFKTKDSIFVYGGDTQDKGDNDIRFVNLLLNFKKDYPDRVIFIIGNRDANKLRFPSELLENYSNDKAFIKKYDNFPYWVKKDVRVTLKDYLKITNSTLNIKNRLNYILKHTMGCKEGCFERRKKELSILLNKNISNISDDDVVSSFLNSVMPIPENIKKSNDNYMLKYLMNGQIAYIFGKHIFVHGSINENNIGRVPKSKKNIENIYEWVNKLNEWFHKELNEYIKDPTSGGISKKRKAYSILDYSIPFIAKTQISSKQITKPSVVYSDNLKNGNGAFINNKVIKQLNNNGIYNVITGHKPHGDCPLVIRNKNLIAISADISYSNINYMKEKNIISNDTRGNAVCEVLLYSNGDIKVHGILANKTKYNYLIKHKDHKDHKDHSQYIGMQLKNKYWVKNVIKDKFLISIGKGFDIFEKWVTMKELKELLK